MGCAYAIVAYGPKTARCPRIVEAAFDEVDRIDRLMSHYKPESPSRGSTARRPRGPVRGRAGAVRLHRRMPALQPRVGRRLRHHRGAPDEGLGVLPRRRPPSRRRGARRELQAADRLPARRARPPSARTIRFDRPGDGAGPRRHRQGLRRRSRGRPAPRARDRGRPGQRGRQHGLRPGRAAGRRGVGGRRPGSRRTRAGRLSPWPCTTARSPSRAATRSRSRRTACATRTSWTRARGGRCRAC